MLLVADPSLLERLLARLEGADPMWAYCLLGVFALIEFVFPPFPGDLLTVGSAFVIRARGWSMVSAFLAILLGSMAGGALQFGLGRYVRKHALDHPGSWMARTWLGLEPWRRKVDTHGALLILVSRFLAVLRGPLLLAAGMTQVHLPSATVAFVVGVGAWNALLLLLGSIAGSDPVRVGRWLGTYALLLWVLLGAVILVWWLRWRRSQRRPAA
jgi:membrane protein DedA with SNARE-associated domain